MAEKVSGQGDLRFRVLYTADHLPPETAAVLVKAHGGFGVDRREGRGEIYFALPGAGIIQISADLSVTKMIRTHRRMLGASLHNTTVWYDHEGIPLLVFPSLNPQSIFTTRLNGFLVHTLPAPTGDHSFSDPKVKAYFAAGHPFSPTDVEYLDGRYYITTGYSKLDFVLTADLTGTNPIEFEWGQLAFGGRGAGSGLFGTGHGITVTPDGAALDISDRPQSEVERFTPSGEFISKVELPKGSLPCDIDFFEGYGIVGCLDGPDRSLGAPIYILKDGELVSTVMPKEELGLEKFKHIHNTVATSVGGKLYLIVQAWNPGDFAILEQVTD